MASLMPAERALRLYRPVDKETLSNRISRNETGLLRSGLGISEQRRQPSTEGLYQIVISEVLNNGGTYPLERGGGRAFAVSSVLDLGLRMFESPRGRNALENVARKAISDWRERSGRGPVSEFEHINLPAAVDEFLHSVRFCFPTVKLDDREGFCHEEDGKTPRSNPRVSAILHLNWQLMDQLYRARLKATATHHSDEYQTEALFRFHRLQFHLAVTVARHLCHLLTKFLRRYESLANEVSDADFLRLARRYDPGKEFEKEFFGGRLKLFVCARGAEDEGCVGRSYVVKSGAGGRRVAGLVEADVVERYLRGDFSVPLMKDVEGEYPSMERYQDVKRRYGASDHEGCRWKEGRNGTRHVPEVGSFKQQPLGVPWDIQGAEYQLLKRACFDPAIRVVGFRSY